MSTFTHGQVAKALGYPLSVWEKRIVTNMKIQAKYDPKYTLEHAVTVVKAHHDKMNSIHHLVQVDYI